MFSSFLRRKSRIQQEPQPVQPQPVQQLTEDDIKFWKDHNLDPIDKKRIEPSIVSTSPYVKLYKESIKILISIRLLKSSSRILTIEDCKYIRKSLPDAHVCINNGLYYDHLFTKYFLKKINKYDEKYREYGTDIYLYLELYNILRRKLKPLPQSIVLHILKNNNIPQSQLYKEEKLSVDPTSYSSKFDKEDVSQNDILTNNIDYSKFKLSGLSIEKVMIRLYIDINNILNLEFTKENYSHVINSFTTLKFVEKIYKISKILNNKLKENIEEYIEKYIKEHNAVNDFFKTNFVDINSSHYFTILEDIYNKIILIYDYFFPYFIHDGIYETNCIGTEDAVTMHDFNYDTNRPGKVTIIPYYTINKILNKCYLTENLFKILLHDIKKYVITDENENDPSKNPINRQNFTEGDINHIVEQLLINLKNYNDDEIMNGLNFLKMIFESELVKANRSGPFDLKKDLEGLLKKINEKSQNILEDLLKDPKFIYFKNANKIATEQLVYKIKTKANVFLSSKKFRDKFRDTKDNIRDFDLRDFDLRDFKGDIQDFTERDIVDIVWHISFYRNTYNEEKSMNCLKFLFKILSSQLDKVNKKLTKLTNRHSKGLKELKENLEYLLIKIDEKSIQRELYYNILVDIKFIKFIDSIKKANYNIARNIKRKVNLTFLEITDNYYEQINKNENEINESSDELKIVGNYTYFLNINLGTEENKRILKLSFLDMPIFNDLFKNNSLRKTRFLNKTGTAILDVAISLIFDDEIFNMEDIPPQKIYDNYSNLFSTYNGGRKKRIVSNKKRSSKKKTI